MLSKDWLSQWEREAWHCVDTYPNGAPPRVVLMAQTITHLVEEVRNLHDVLKLIGVKARKLRPVPKNRAARTRRTNKKEG